MKQISKILESAVKSLENTAGTTPAPTPAPAPAPFGFGAPAFGAPPAPAAAPGMGGMFGGGIGPDVMAAMQDPARLQQVKAQGGDTERCKRGMERVNDETVYDTESGWYVVYVVIVSVTGQIERVVCVCACFYGRERALNPLLFLLLPHLKCAQAMSMMQSNPQLMQMTQRMMQVSEGGVFF